jgi:hypothetical protein
MWSAEYRSTMAAGEEQQDIADFTVVRHGFDRGQVRQRMAELAAAKAQVEEMTTAAERRREAIDKEAERDRIRIDREFSESMATKRTALQREIESARATSRKEAADRLAAADEEARTRIEAVTAQVKRLTAVRDQLGTRLRETKEILDLSESLLEPVAGEAELVEEPKPEAKKEQPVPPQREAKRQPAKR